MAIENIKNNLFTLENDQISFVWNWIDEKEEDCIELFHVRKMILGTASNYMFNQTFVNILRFYLMLKKMEFKKYCLE